ncbi:hypothetical protein C7974DRAFT_323325 [Boeremia exigua]|uniref:uncharacterized protein n=1 Tax=Boeremia exigua TaxID=749465 RepID=UPI001E8EC082|nr:uncharacterized protein C7974DRAFT_323325 [Boeremia exigua]KAH6612022.1 hypothetical protein C7974DRAFT_323325 [Boeremia exigua]
MSQSGSNVTFDSSSTVEIAHRRPGITPSGSRVTTPYSYAPNKRDYFHQPQLHPQQLPVQLSRHDTALQEHAKYVVRTARADDDADTPLDVSRRGSSVWSQQQAYEGEASTNTRNPMMPQRTDNTTPPTMEEIMRKMTSDTSSRSSLGQSDAVFSRPSTIRSSITGTDVDVLTRNDTGISLGGLARSMTKKIPSIKPNRTPSEKLSQGSSLHGAYELEDIPSPPVGKKGRKLSFQVPSGLQMKKSLTAPQKPSPVVEEPSACVAREKGSFSGSQSSRGGLAARRQVKMDLTLPVGLPDLSKAKERQATHPAVFSSITPSRPRSPKTPWIREKELDWSRAPSSAPVKTAQTVRLQSAPTDAFDTITLKDVFVELGVGPALPPETPPFATTPVDRPPRKVRDRCYTSRKSTKGSHTGRLSTSDSDFGSTPDGHWTPGAEEGMGEEEVRTQKDLFQLARMSKSVRARRWPWNKSKTGSEEQPPMRSERNDSSKSLSVNIFKRANRFSKPSDMDNEEKVISKGVMSTSWRKEKSTDRPPLPSASLAKMSVPPVFVPPGSEKMATPPVFDSNREVRGKLADFFFEIDGIPSAKRKPKASPGYWDSNAVLMSLHKDHGLNNTEDEEGPEGRPPPAAFHFGPVNDTPGPVNTPGLFTGPDGYLRIRGFPQSPSGHSPPTPSASDSWFRQHYGDYAAEEDSLTVAALREADERRKFEWLVPEHLPNSPLCPLHVKYVGLSKGLCYWHGEKSNGWGVEPRRDYVSDPMRIGQGKTRGWEVGKWEPPKVERKMRSLRDLVNA